MASGVTFRPRLLQCCCNSAVRFRRPYQAPAGTGKPLGTWSQAFRGAELLTLSTTLKQRLNEAVDVGCVREVGTGCPDPVPLFVGDVRGAEMDLPRCSQPLGNITATGVFNEERDESS